MLRLYKNPESAKLLNLVMQGQPDQVMLFLEGLKKQDQENFWKVLLRKEKALEEHCGREWEAVSPMQFAYWAGDDEMRDLLECYLPKSANKMAKAQYGEVDEKGLAEVTWVDPNPKEDFFSRSSITGHRYENYRERKPDVKTLVHHNRLSALKELIDAYDHILTHWSDKDLCYDWARENYHVKTLGAKQRELPIYGLQELCKAIRWEKGADLETPDLLTRTCKVDGDEKALALKSVYSKGKYYSGLGYEFGLYPNMFGEGMNAAKYLSVWRSDVVHDYFLNVRNTLNKFYCQRMGIEKTRDLDHFDSWGDQADKMREKCTIC